MYIMCGALFRGALFRVNKVDRQVFIPSVGLSMLSWSLELDALEEAETDDTGGRGPTRVVKLVSLDDL